MRISAANPRSRGLAPTDARKLIRTIIASKTDRVSISGHALDEMEKDELILPDINNVLRGGTVDPAEFVSGTWRYRVHTTKICAVVAFRSETHLRIVTAWRKKKS